MKPVAAADNICKRRISTLANGCSAELSPARLLNGVAVLNRYLRPLIPAFAPPMYALFT